MQGRSDPQRELLDVESLAGHLLPEGGVFAFLAQHRHELFSDALFADLFATGRGRPSVPVEVVASVIVLQALHGLSDREATEALVFDLRWKAACGLAVTDAGFHPTTLTYWRRRLSRSEHPNRIFDAVKTVVSETGVLHGKTRRALDSTVLDDAVATQDTVTQLIAAIRRVAREVPGAGAVIAEHAGAHDYSDPGKPRIAWDDKDARTVLIDALVTDAHRILGHLPDQELDPKAGEAVALLALVAGQDVEPVEDSDGTDGRWRIARKVAPDRVISTVDPTPATPTTRSRRQDGYKAHIVIEPDTGIITDTALTPAAGAVNSDATVGIDLLINGSGPGSDPARPDTGGRFEVLADSAYATRDALAALEGDQHTAIIKPPAVAGPCRGRVHDRRLHCHRAHHGSARIGELPERCHPTHHRDPQRDLRGCVSGLPVAGAVHHQQVGAVTDSAPTRCAATSPPRPRSAPDFQAVYRWHRPMVERSIAWLVTGRNRRLRFRGTRPNDLWLHHRVAGLNLRRLLALGLHRTHTSWAIA